MKWRQVMKRIRLGLFGRILLAILCGVALGVLIGMLVPRGKKERELLQGTGRQLAGKVTGTVQAVKEAGKAEFDALLPSREDAKERVTSLFGNLVDAAKGAAQKA